MSEKEKKLTRKQAEEKLVEIKAAMPQVILDSNCVETEKVIVMDHYIDNGEHVFELYCHDCGHTEVKKSDSSYFNTYGYSCPHCGNKKFSGSRYYPQSNQLFVREKENGFEW
jgi:predicted RNA-binding Zn-ribbon protein involved in translation (DUF1610 family)